MHVHVPPATAVRNVALACGRYGVSYLVKDNYLYFHITSWRASGKSADAFGRCSATPPPTPSPPVLSQLPDVGVWWQGHRAGAFGHARRLRSQEENGAKEQRAGAGLACSLSTRSSHTGARTRCAAARQAPHSTCTLRAHTGPHPPPLPRIRSLPQRLCSAFCSGQQMVPFAQANKWCLLLRQTNGKLLHLLPPASTPPPPVDTLGVTFDV